MRDLRERMHAGVGPPRAIQLELAALRHFADRAIDFSLNRAGILLNLPPAIARSVVFDEQLEPWQFEECSEFGVVGFWGGFRSVAV